MLAVTAACRALRCVLVTDGLLGQLGVIRGRIFSRGRPRRSWRDIQSPSRAPCARLFPPEAPPAPGQGLPFRQGTATPTALLFLTFFPIMLLKICLCFGQKR